MSKLDTSPKAIRRLINKKINWGLDREYTMQTKLKDLMQMLDYVANEKDEAERSSSEKVALIQKTLAMHPPPPGWVKLQEELSRLGLDAEDAPFLGTHKKSL